METSPSRISAVISTPVWCKMEGMFEFLFSFFFFFSFTGDVDMLYERGLWVFLEFFFGRLGPGVSIVMR